MRKLFSVLAVVGVLAFCSQVLWVVGFSLIWIILRVSLIVGIAFLFLKWPRKEIGITTGEYSFRKLVVMGIVAGISVYLFVGLNHLLIVFHFFGEQPDAVSISFHTVLMGIVLAPLAEELYSRGFLCALLKNWYTENPVIIIGATAVSFSLGHFSFLNPSTQQLIFAGLIIPVGVVLAHLFLKTKSIIPAITAHMTINFLDLSVSAISRYPVGTAVLVVVLSVSLIVLVITHFSLIDFSLIVHGISSAEHVLEAIIVGCLIMVCSFLCSYGGLYIQWKILLFVGLEQVMIPQRAAWLQLLGIVTASVSVFYLIVVRKEMESLSN